MKKLIISSLLALAVCQLANATALNFGFHAYNSGDHPSAATQYEWLGEAIDFYNLFNNPDLPLLTPDGGFVLNPPIVEGEWKLDSAGLVEWNDSINDGPTSITIPAGYTYATLKYDSKIDFWYLGGDEGVLTVTGQNAISHYAVVGVPDGGITAILLGMGSLGLGYLKNRKV